MAHTSIKVDCRLITDWNSFFDVFAGLLGFPAFFGRNMNAWVDCLTYADDPEHCMTNIHALPGGVLVLQCDYIRDFANRCPDIYAALIENAAFVNHRRMEMGEGPVLTLSFFQ